MSPDLNLLLPLGMSSAVSDFTKPFNHFGVLGCFYTPLIRLALLDLSKVSKDVILNG